MQVVDELLEDEELVDAVYEAQGERHPPEPKQWAAADARGGGVAQTTPPTHYAAGTVIGSRSFSSPGDVPSQAIL